jgi:N6-L-threonylcarbamoyladenine synthase
MQVEGLGQYQMLGETIDDAAGEAFDKSAQLLGLGYPGGPEIARWSAQGDAQRFELPRPLLKRPTLDFSFAGLKTAVLTQVQKLKTAGQLNDQARADMAAAVQAAIVEVLVTKCRKALQDTGLKQIVVAGGVGANQLLRKQFNALQETDQIEVLFAPPHLCTDNGVMIAWAAALHLLAGRPPAMDSGFTVRPRWPLSTLSLKTS